MDEGVDPKDNTWLDRVDPLEKFQMKPRENGKPLKQFRIALCRFPGNGMEASGGVTWLMETYKKMRAHPLVEGVLDITISDTPITMSRNRAVKEALLAGCDYILMLDSDMVPDYLVGKDPTARPFWDTAWEFMMALREMEAKNPGQTPATVAAPYCGPPPFEHAFVFRWKSMQSDCPDPIFRLEMMEREEAAQRGGIEEVAAMPTGLILYDARVFKNLPKPWYDYEWGDDERSVKVSTEDVYQTRNASLLKMPQFILWDSWAAHMKTKAVPKPHVHTRDMVARTMQEAILADRNAGDRLLFVNRHDRHQRA
jgi:hypothetical protein